MSFLSSHGGLYRFENFEYFVWEKLLNHGTVNPTTFIMR
jgi:hypothetical protein